MAASNFLSKAKQGLGIARVWAKQKLGKAEKSPEDPRFRVMLSQLAATRGSLQALDRSVQALIRYRSAEADNAGTFAEMLMRLGSGEGPKNDEAGAGADADAAAAKLPAQDGDKAAAAEEDDGELVAAPLSDVEAKINGPPGMVAMEELLQFCEAQSTSLKKQREQTAALQELVANPVRALLNGPIKDAVDLRRRYQIAHLDVDARRETVANSAEKGPEKRAEAEAAFTDADAKFSEVRDALTEKCAEIEKAKAALLTENLQKYLQVQLRSAEATVAAIKSSDNKQLL